MEGKKTKGDGGPEKSNKRTTDQNNQFKQKNKNSQQPFKPSINSKERTKEIIP